MYLQRVLGQRGDLIEVALARQNKAENKLRQEIIRTRIEGLYCAGEVSLFNAPANTFERSP